MKKGLVHIYCGDGKGKTTTAVGIAVRAAGAGKNVLFVQFLKARPTSELRSFKECSHINTLRTQHIKKFAWEMTAEEQAQIYRESSELLEKACLEACRGAYDLLVLDEALGACGLGFIEEDVLLAFIREKPESLELVITGRNPSDALIQVADYITEMCKIKHPYDNGISARKGIEY